MTTPVSLLAGLLGVVLLLAGAATAEPLDLWPLVVRDGRPVAGLETTRVAGPIFERWRAWSGPGGPAPGLDGAWDEGWSLRPLAARLGAADEQRLELLHPIAGVRAKPDRTRWWLAPWFDRTVHHTSAEGAAPDAVSSSGTGAAGSDVNEAAERDTGRTGDRWTAGFAYGGRTDAGEAYGGLFPVAGVAKQRFGFERLEFLLFPLYGRSRDHHGFQRTNVLWPFFSFGSGGGRSLLRIWPFYGHDRREGEWDRRFALWPFFHWRTEQPGQPAERRIRLALPFYGEVRSEHARSRFVLGPLYMDAVDTRSGARSVDIGYPFVRLAHRPAREGLEAASEIRFEPFFRRRVGPGMERRGALLGAYDRMHLERDGLRVDSLRLGFVSRFERIEDLETGAMRRRQDVWPLFTRREHVWSDAEGAPHSSGTLFAPWPLPVAGEAFQRNATGLFTLYEHRHRDGESRRDWLHGLVRSRVAEDYRLDAISWLGRIERDGEQRRVRLLGLPFSNHQNRLP